ncbi:unnamed protein product [Sphagnum balticum]
MRGEYLYLRYQLAEERLLLADILYEFAVDLILEVDSPVLIGVVGRGVELGRLEVLGEEELLPVWPSVTRGWDRRRPLPCRRPLFPSLFPVWP